jgi:hypothetical protein
MAIRLGVPAVFVAAFVFAAATIAMVVAEELDLLLLVAAVVFATVLTAVLFALFSLAGHASRRETLLAALVGGLLLATPIPWEWNAGDEGYVALVEAPRLVALSDATPLVPYVSDTLD